MPCQHSEDPNIFTPKEISTLKYVLQKHPEMPSICGYIGQHINVVIFLIRSNTQFLAGTLSKEMLQCMDGWTNHKPHIGHAKPTQLPIHSLTTKG